MPTPDIHPVSIEGKIVLSDGVETQFSINPDLGWQQWGVTKDYAGLTVDLMDDLAQASGEHLRERAEEADEDD